jgi:hypothetical protein
MGTESEWPFPSSSPGAGHTISYEHGGPPDETGWIQAHCTCGWVGQKFYAWQNYQSTLIHDEATDHKRSAS